MRRCVALFPGQGCQRVGMGRGLVERHGAAATSLFERANAALGFDLAALMQSGPAAVLNKTEYAQPAILACAVAAYRLEMPRDLTVVASAGHSLGEYASLVAADALDFESACVLVHHRGILMQAAADAKGRSWAMAAVLNLSLDDALAIVSECPEPWMCEVSASNGPLQTVLAGCTDGVNWALDCVKQRVPARTRAVRLPVSAPFHTSVMAPAAREFNIALSSSIVKLRKPAFPLVFNSTGTILHYDDGAIKRALADGIRARVRWADCINALASTVPAGTLAVDIGATGLVRFGLPASLVAAPSDVNVTW